MAQLLTFIIVLIAALVAANAWALRTRPGDREIIERYVAMQDLRTVSIRRRRLRRREGGFMTGPSRWTRVFVVTAEEPGGARQILTLAIDPWRRPVTVVRMD